MYTISSYKDASEANIDMGDVGEPPAGARISRGPQGPEILVKHIAGNENSAESIT